MDQRLIKQAAAALGAEEAAVAAVIEVESAGAAMVSAGLATVRFEGATFRQRTGGRFDESHPELSMSDWRDNNRYVLGGVREWQRVTAAALLDHEAAYKSASYGAFQIMGFNYAAAGYDSVHAFVAAMNAGEQAQVEAFVRLLKSWGLDDALQRKDWRAFTHRYNGPGQVDRYSAKIAEAYRRHKAGPARPMLRLGDRGPYVSRLQSKLKALDLYNGLVTGRFDESTEAAVRHFQNAMALPIDGIVGPKTWHVVENAVPNFPTPTMPPEHPRPGILAQIINAIAALFRGRRTQE